MRGESRGERERERQRKRERERCLRLRDSISIICRFVDSELCDYAPPLHPRLLFILVLLHPPPSRGISSILLPALSARATPSPSSAPEPSIRLFARNRFHVFGPLLHLYKRARTTNIGHCARHHGRFALRACPCPLVLVCAFVFVLILGLIVAHLPPTASICRAPAISNRHRISCQISFLPVNPTENAPNPKFEGAT